jgi:hypothetical protein
MKIEVNIKETEEKYNDSIRGKSSLRSPRYRSSMDEELNKEITKLNIMEARFQIVGLMAFNPLAAVTLLGVKTDEDLVKHFRKQKWLREYREQAIDDYKRSHDCNCRNRGGW